MQMFSKYPKLNCSRSAAELLELKLLSTILGVIKWRFIEHSDSCTKYGAHVA